MKLLPVAKVPLDTIYLNNKYTQWYYNIIQLAVNTQKNGYTERHHIIPKCLGGDNSKSNIVRVTAREHYICHWLLTKMTTGSSYYKLEKALACFNRQSEGQVRTMSSGMYQRAKLAAILGMKNKPSPLKGRKMKSPPWNKGKKLGPNPKSAAAQKGVPKPKISAALKGRKRPDISARQKGRTLSEEHKQKISKSITGRQHPNKGKPNGRKGIPTGRSPANKGIPSPLKGMPSKNKGKVWWTNGMESKFRVESPGEGWIQGRTTKGRKIGPMSEERKRNISLAKLAKNKPQEHQ